MDEMTDLIDMNEIREIMDDDRQLIKDCFIDFIEEYPKMLLKIKNAIDKEDLEELNTSAHKLKGSLKYLAAKPAADIAYKLEDMGKRGDVENARNELENLTHACDALKVFMASYEA